TVRRGLHVGKIRGLETLCNRMLHHAARLGAGRRRHCAGRMSHGMKVTPRLIALAVVVLVGSQMLAQETPSSPASATPAAKNPWAYSLTVDGYVVPDGQSYVNPV